MSHALSSYSSTRETQNSSGEIYLHLDREKEWTKDERIELAISKIHQLKTEGKYIPPYTSFAKFYDIPATTLWHRVHGRKTHSESTEDKQFLNHGEEKALEK